MYLFKQFEFQQIEYEEIGLLAQTPTSHLTNKDLRIDDVWNAKFEKTPKNRFHPYKKQEVKIDDKELEDILLNIINEQKEYEQKQIKTKKNIKKQNKKNLQIENYKQQVSKEQLLKPSSPKIEYIKLEDIININSIDKDLEIELMAIEIQKENNNELSKMERFNLKRWYEKYISLQKFIEKHEKLPTRRFQNYKHENLYMWTWRQKKNYYNGKLSKVLIKKLEEIKEWEWTYKI
jgi:hypothetical protein